MSKPLWIKAALLLVFIFSLAACSRTPAPAQLPTNTSAAATATTEAAPQSSQLESTPAQAVANPYPGPVVEYVPYEPYPAPVQGEKLEWTDVASLLASGDAAEVYQAYSLQVTIKLKDGSVVYSNEPAKDDIFKALDACGAPCAGIRRVSEWW